MNILVLHGPNLNLLGERPGDEKGKTLAELDRAIRAHADSLGVAVKILQSNHEGVLVDTLHAERRWADAVVINPGALTHTSYVLREAIAATGKPVIEVHLTDIRRRESWRRKSVIKDVCEAQVMGKGFNSYLLAMDKFAPRFATAAKKKAGAEKKPAPEKKSAEKSLGRRVSEAAKTAGPVSAKPKSLGRAVARAATTMEPATERLTRALVRQKIAERLSGKLSPSGLATWARSKWLDVQRGAAAESGQRELLEDSLQQLVLASVPPAKLSDEELIELMTQLDG